MDVTPRTYRDDANQLLDDIEVADSYIERVVVTRNGDGTATVRAQTTDDTVVEHEVAITSRQYAGLKLLDDTVCVHPDIRAALTAIGLTVEPPQLSLDDRAGESQ